MKWVNVISGVVLFLAPFVFGYSGTPAALWAGLIMGIVIAVLGFMNAHKWLTAAGMLTILAPFILGFSGVGAALWICLIFGILITLIDGYRGFFSGEAKSSGSPQQGHA